MLFVLYSKSKQMKRNILLFSLLLWVASAFSQQTITLNNPTCGTYTAAKQIMLSPGFHSSASSIGTFHAYIDPSNHDTIPPGDVFENAIDFGILTDGMTLSDTKDSRLYHCDYSPNSNYGFSFTGGANDIIYKFTILKKTIVHISHCDSQVPQTDMDVFDSTKTEVTFRYTSCPSTDLALIDRAIYQDTLPAGTYYILSQAQEPSEEGIITTTISVGYPGDTFHDPFNLGTCSAGYTHSDTENTANFNNDYGQPSNDVYYKFTTTNSLTLSVSQSSPNVSHTLAYLLDSLGNLITSSGSGSLQQNIQSGTYYVVTEGAGSSNGNITTNISFALPPGDTFGNAIVVGVLDYDNDYTDTENTNNFNNDYKQPGNKDGQPSNDVYYQFRVPETMEVILSHCGSAVSDTYLHLLNSSGTEIASDDNYSGDGACSNNNQAYIRQTLTAGTYYAVSEGSGNLNGNITTTIQAIPTGTEIQTESGSSGTSQSIFAQNYIYTTTPIIASTNAGTLTTAQSLQTIQYFDGLGRPAETVQRGITPSGADLVVGIEYDDFGHQQRQWLPGAVVGNNGNFVTDFASPAVNTNGDYSPYTTTEYEPSPLDRVTGQYGAGADWYSNDKKKTIAYTTNGSDVKLFEVNGTGLTVNGNYAAGTLSGQQTTDEDGKTVEEFTDNLGHKVLSRVAGNYDTYYVYDDYDNLRYVLPSLAADAINATSDCGETTGTPLDLYGYIYHYDGRKRCIEKKLPGCAWIYMVYDYAGRLILSQDGNQHLKNQWTVNTYDCFDRPLYSGLIYDNRSRATMETAYSQTIFNESYTGNGFAAGYTVNNITPSRLLTVNYYDNYNFLNYTGNNTNGMLTYIAQQGYSAAYSNPPVGELGGTRIYHLNDSTRFEVTALYYDKYGRTVQTRATNHLGGYDIIYNALDFIGKPTATMKTHGINGTNVSETEVYTYSYDQAQRLLTTTHSLNGATPVTLAANSYDDLGRLASKARQNGTETTNYSYNVRSWITTINKGSWEEQLFYQNDPSNPLYNGNIARSTWSYHRRPTIKGYVYTYDALNRLTQANYGECNGLTHALHSQDEYFTYDKMGNVMSIQRKNQGSLIDDMTFSYSGNQLLKITDVATNSYSPYNLTEYTNSANNVATEFLYDANGNLTADLGKTIVAIRYNVLNLPDTIQFQNGNQIINTYNADGQKLRTKYYTSMTDVNLPVGKIHGAYSTSNATLRLDDYFGSILYENGTDETPTNHPLTKILTPEGYVDYVTSGKPYCYYNRDHLGSIHEVSSYIGQSGTVVQRTQYYPSGTPFEQSYGAGVQPYKFTGKELITMHGLNWQDNGARLLDNVRMQWTTIDPLCEKYYSTSPYAYCLNNPVLYIDPFGLWTAVTGGYSTNDPNDISNFIGYYQSQQAVSNANPTTNQMINYVSDVVDNKQTRLSDGSLFISQVAVDKSSFGWEPEDKSYEYAWNEINNYQFRGKSNRGQLFNTLNTVSTVGGIASDITKATGFLSPMSMKIGSATQNIGIGSAFGYGFFGLSVLSNLSLYATKDPTTGKRNQSGLATGINIGVGLVMLRMPLPISIAYGGGSIMYPIEKNSYQLLINSGEDVNSGLFNTDFLH